MATRKSSGGFSGVNGGEQRPGSYAVSGSRRKRKGKNRDRSSRPPAQGAAPSAGSPFGEERHVDQRLRPSSITPRGPRHVGPLGMEEGTSGGEPARRPSSGGSLRLNVVEINATEALEPRSSPRASAPTSPDQPDAKAALEPSSHPPRASVPAPNVDGTDEAVGEPRAADSRAASAPSAAPQVTRTAHDAQHGARDTLAGALAAHETRDTLAGVPAVHGTHEHGSSLDDSGDQARAAFEVAELLQAAFEQASESAAQASSARAGSPKPLASAALAKHEDEDRVAVSSVLDARFSLRSSSNPSDEPKSYVMRLFVGALSAVILAAGYVALREQLRGESSRSREPAYELAPRTEAAAKSAGSVPTSSAQDVATGAREQAEQGAKTAATPPASGGATSGARANATNATNAGVPRAASAAGANAKTNRAAAGAVTSARASLVAASAAAAHAASAAATHAAGAASGGAAATATRADAQGPAQGSAGNGEVPSPERAAAAPVTSATPGEALPDNPYGE